MKDEIKIFFSTRKNQNELKPLIQNIENTIGCKHEIVMYRNLGTHSLTELYNFFITQYSHASKTSIYVLLHDDVEITTINWGNKLLNLFNKNQDYSIIGLAGSKFYDGSKGWWLYDKEFLAGQVIHRVNGKGMWIIPFSSVYKEEHLEDVVVIDGVFISFDLDKLTSHFDMNVKGFHFYDMDFCLSNFKDGKYKIGVTTDIRIIHHSFGALNQKWEENRKQIIEKYNSYFPLSISESNKNNED